jgi:hypothetical protein
LQTIAMATSALTNAPTKLQQSVVIVSNPIFLGATHKTHLKTENRTV